MENAADALKIAFAVFVFVFALTITFSIISQAKSTADVVFYYGDETNFYEYSYSKGDSGKNRKVSVSQIIPTLYRYCDESIGVEIKLADSSTAYFFDLNNIEYLVKEGENINTSQRQFDRKENLEKFITEILLSSTYKDTMFIEEFVEVPISGIYKYGSDGTELAVSSGGKKVYITYTEYVEET